LWLEMGLAKPGLDGRLAPLLELTGDGTEVFFMAVKIRLKRIGAKNHPVYRVVVADGRSPRDGRFIEELGTYNPQRQGSDNYTLDFARASYWLSKGAQPSETVASLIKRAQKTQPQPAPEPVAG
jgi:small subunit ribosomal protein S16